MSEGKRLYHQHCGVAKALDFIGERWTLLIVRDLLIAPKRYSDLLESLPGLTTNLLARRLKNMEDDGLINKVRLPRPTPAVVYCLTPLGRELGPLVFAACDWGSRFLTQPGAGETVDLSWSLLRLRTAYRGSYSLTFELGTADKLYHVVLLPKDLHIRGGSSNDSELRITGSDAALLEMFFGPATASEVVSRGQLTVVGKFGRWPRVLAAFGLR